MKNLNLKAMRKITYGLYIVGAKSKDFFNAQTANAVLQISSEPATVAVSINKQNLTHEYIHAGGYLTVSVLAQEAPLSIVGQFGFKSGREVDKFSGVNYSTTTNGLPYVTDYTLAYLEAKIVGELDAGTHTVFWGEVNAAEILKEGEPMTYAYYHQVKRGSTPPTAPSYISKEKEGSSVKMDRYVCNICGYVYDPEEGDPENDISPGTSFDDLPEDWVCPVCGAGKEDFEKES